MPDTTQSDRLFELRNVFPVNTREIQTLEIRQVATDVGEQLDLVFLIDTTGSMASRIAEFITAIEGVAAGLAEEFPVIRYSIVTFKDEGPGETKIVLSGGEPFYDLGGALDILGAISVSGGGDSLENGFGAAKMAARELPWDHEAARAAILVSDVGSHERGSTLSQARNALLNESIFFFYGISLSDEDYDSLAEVTRGARLEETTGELLTEEIISVLRGIASPVEDPIYLVNDNRNFTALIETGAEVDFLQRSFSIEPFTSGEEGSIGVPVTIDNSDLQVSRFLTRAKAYTLPLEVIIRIYEEGDTSGPQNVPPLKLYATDFEIKGSLVSCQLSWIDLHNANFPNEFYTPTKCPSLQ
jgi:hypothetical protein